MIILNSAAYTIVWRDIMKITLAIAIIAIIFFLGTDAAIGQNAGAASEHAFVGNKDCRKCHLKEFKSWNETKMANAYEILKSGQRAEAKERVGLDPEKDYTQDVECLPCHTTGYGKSGGFVSLEKTPELAGVGCESCHGAGAEYTKKEYMSLQNKEYKLAELVKVGLVAPVTGTRCTEVCHNENSPFFNKDEPFDFEKRRLDGNHKLFPLKYEH